MDLVYYWLFQISLVLLLLPVPLDKILFPYEEREKKLYSRDGDVLD